MTGVMESLSMDYATGKPVITLALNERREAVKVYEELKDCGKVSVEISKYREKRSLNANAYAWKLLTEIGNVIRSSKDDVYLQMLKRYGQSEIISALSKISVKGYFKYYEEDGESILNGKSFTHYKVYKGSSEFDTREMSIFIDGIVDEAKALGIQTETPDEIERLKSLWKGV